MSQEVFETPGFSALLDLSFTRFVTISFIRVIYILWLVGIALGWLVVVIGAFAQGILVGLFAIVFGAVIAAVYALLVRMMLELVVVIFRIGEHNVRSRRAIEKSAPCLQTECSMQRSAGGM